MWRLFMDENLPSIKKLQNDIKAVRKISFLLPKEKRKQVVEIDNQLTHLTTQFELFNKNFSDFGWCAYDSMNLKLMEQANQTFKIGGIDKGEEILLQYYKDEVKNITQFLKCKSKSYMDRADLIDKALEDHFDGRYHASIPLFLIIIDGSVNDFTKSKGFFAEGTDVSAWDCLVGCDDGLSKMKDLFNRRRNKTNLDEIRMPYRNGILHGRDLNYANEYVSCKCLSLMFALADWMQMKNNEENRKEKFIEETNPPSFSESLKMLKQIKIDKNEIRNWKKRYVEIGMDIPNVLTIDDCKEYNYLIPIVEMFSAWESKNYGKLSILLKNMFSYEESDRKRAGECRNFFDSKELISYELKEIEERGCAITRVLVEVKWKSLENIHDELLEFGVIYQNESKEIALPWKNNGEWIIMPWNVQGLYK